MTRAKAILCMIEGLASKGKMILASDLITRDKELIPKGTKVKYKSRPVKDGIAYSIASPDGLSTTFVLKDSEKLTHKIV